MVDLLSYLGPPPLPDRAAVVDGHHPAAVKDENDQNNKQNGGPFQLGERQGEPAWL